MKKCHAKKSDRLTNLSYCVWPLYSELFLLTITVQGIGYCPYLAHHWLAYRIGKPQLSTLFLRNCLASQNQISYGASMG